MFDGTGDVTRWIARVEFALELDDVAAEKQAAAIAAKLDGAAFDTYQGLSTADKKNAAKIKEALGKTYGLGRLEAWQQALQYRVGPGDAIDAAAEHLRKLVGVVGQADEGENPCDRIAACMLVRALPADVSASVQMQCGAELKFSEVRECAKRLMAGYAGGETGAVASQKGSRRENKRGACYTCGGDGHFSRDCPQKGGSAGSGSCRRCGGEGHFAAQCPTPRRCFGCGGTGHIQVNCPKNGQAGAALVGDAAPAPQRLW